MNSSGVVGGAAAGCAATLPMTLVMEALHRRLPPSERYPLPPRRITMRMADAVGVRPCMSESERLAATLAAHFAMGTAAGATYGLLARDLPGPAALKGAAFGLGVWAANYVGLLPAFGVLRPATRHPPRRIALMIAAHMVWGAIAGVLAGGRDGHSRTDAA